MNFNLREIGSKLSTRGWITVGAATLVGILFIYILLTMASSPSYTTVIAGQSPAQTGKVTSALSGAGIPYQLSNNGTAVSVETAKESQARVVLDEQGLLLGSGASQSLESYLGKTSLGESNFQQEQQNTSALEQQLDQTIEGMNGINQAQVLLSVPDDTTDLFSGTTTQASASVLLNTNGSLGTSTVKAIAEAVADAVPTLSQSKVTVTDQNGDLLWPNGSGTTTGSSLTAKQSAENAYDTQIADEADEMLATTLGPGKALVHINADLNANQQQIQSVKYGKTGTPLSAKLSNESLNGTGATTGGTAGNTPTQIAAYAGTNGNGKSKYSNKSSNTSYGVNKTVSTSTIAPGKVNQQSISVLVNSTVPATDLPTIRAAVQNAVGFNKKRGDTISVGTLPFAKIPAAAAASSTTKTLGDVKYVLVGGGVLVFLLFMGRMLRRRETEDFAGKPTWLRELEMPRSLSELEAQTRMVDLDGPTMVQRLRAPVNVAKQQVEELVDRDPERVAQQIRQWMTED
jgi:flagellar M-ring protein FliF